MRKIVKMKGEFMESKNLKTSDAQKKANERWKRKNKDLQRRYVKRSTAKNYILKTLDTQDELEEVKDWIKEKEKNLKK